MDRPDSCLHWHEDEDLVDYGDSGVETETDNSQKTPVVETIEDIDIFADDLTQTEDFDQKDDSKTVFEESAENEDATTANTITSTTTKTSEAAAVIKSLNDLLVHSTFRAALELVGAGSTLDLGFWADGLDFALSLKLLGAAKVKTCKYRAGCRNKKCTFDHGDADRTAIIAGKKSRKLCSVINTPTGCSNGRACWFSHEAFGVACADGDLRTTCVKGIYCVYKHSDDDVVASVEHVDQPVVQVDNGEMTNNFEALNREAHPVELIVEMRTGRAAPATTPGTIASPKQQTSGVKRRRDPEDEAGGKPEKAHRIYERHSRQERSGRRHGGRDCSPERVYSENPSQNRRSSGQGQRGDRTGASRGRSRQSGRGGRSGRGGHGGRGAKGDTCRPSEERQSQTDKRSDKKKSLSDRVSYD